MSAVGGNFKFKHLKVFGSTENLYKNAKKYRKVYDESECKYIYGEVSFYNKLFDEKEWSTQVRLTCKDVTNNKHVCELKKDLTIKTDQNIVNVREGWGTPNSGWWKKGKYRWDAYIDEKFVGSVFFYIVDGGVVSAENNPYISIKQVRLFESDLKGTPISDRKYIKTFAKEKTRYVNIEMTINVLQDNLPLDFQFNFYNDSGQHKAYMEYFNENTSNLKTVTFDTGYGTNNGNYWFEDKYSLEILFMDELIGVVPFAVGLEEEELQGENMPFGIQPRTNSTEIGGVEVNTGKPTFEEATKEFNELIGLNSVKKQIEEFSTYLKFIKIREEKGFKESNNFNLHTVFKGNPGTGKTTVAKMLGRIYYSLDLLTKGHVHEVGRVDLVGEYIGQTAPKVKKAIDKARGGILFIDEAYALSDRGDDGKDFGKEVIEVLLKEMSDGKGDIAVVFAGYPKEMDGFLGKNPGMRSRISSVIDFPDYTPDELMEIADFASKKRDIQLSEEVKTFLNKRIVEVYRNRDEHFGNARFVNGIIEECKQNMALRIMKQGNIEELENDNLMTIVLEDVEKVFGITTSAKVHIPVDEALYNEALEELHSLIGLEEIKQDVDEMAKLVRYYTEIGRDVKKSFSIHTVFTGNPGTGKTTIARILVKIYKALGVLERGHIVEIDRKELVAGYIGQTAIKTDEAIQKAMGGGLFIDEAYSLTQGGEKDFGKEAVDTLLKRMEDYRGDFMVIAAGYPNEMKRFLEMNPGLMSRFDRTLKFPDYSAEQLMEIAVAMFEKENLYLSTEAKDHLLKYIDILLEHKHKYFGNARTMRKVVKEVTRRQHLRLAAIANDQRTHEMVKTIAVEDLENFKLIEQNEDQHKGIGFRR
ncbi:MAG: AAA family ATPase [Aureispira sp.]|nr:AAA family ATPase [Aureispira sp.]